MTSGGADALKAAVRRSLPFIIGLTILGIVAVNVFEHVAGPKYSASATVEIPTTPLLQVLTDTTSPLIDPQQTQDTAQVLGGHLQVYRIAAQRTGGRYGSAGDIQNATSVSAVANTDLLTFTSSGSSSNQAIGRANAAGRAFVIYYTTRNSTVITNAIAGLQTSLAAATNNAQRTTIQGELSKLNQLSASNSGNATFGPAALTASQTSPATGKDSAIGLGIGLVIALLLVALREAVDTTVRSESDVEELLGAPVLGTIRSLPRRTQIVTMGRYEALYADSYALIAAQLATDSADGERSVLAVTSALASEGKTTTVANLAVALARRGQRVLLADFDFHKPTLSNLLGVPAGAAGALQVLDGSESLEDVLWEISLDGQRPEANWRADPERIEQRRMERRSLSNGRDPQGALMILPSGKAEHSSMAGKTPRMGALLREMSAYADLVVLDTPPALLTVEMTELAQLIDMVVVVVRQGRVSQRTLSSLGRHARSWPAELTGAVLTDVPAQSGYGAYYGSK